VSRVLVDSDVLLDVFKEDPVWFEWSERTLCECAELAVLVINPIVYAELAAGFRRKEDLDAALPTERFYREALPWDGAFLAGTSFVQYRRLGGERHSPLPAFYIGAHAAVAGMTLLIRDAARYRTYFPKLEILAP
jgi:predicted nucleic acid-binding protein